MFTADRLYDALMMDIWPSAGAMVDFGLDNPSTRQSLYEAYQNKVRKGEITQDDLRQAVGNGPALSALINQKVVTAYDLLAPTDGYNDPDNDE